MTTSDFRESIVEEAALAWLEVLGFSIAQGPDIAPDAPLAERATFNKIVLESRLRQRLSRLNPNLPSEAIEDAFRKLTRSEGPTLETRNLAFHAMLVDGVPVEYRRPDGSIAGAQARVIDFFRAGQQRLVGGQPVHRGRKQAQSQA